MLVRLLRILSNAGIQFARFRWQVRYIRLANQLSLWFLPLLLVFVVFNYLLMGNMLTVAFSAFSFLTLLLILLANFRGHVQASRMIAAFLAPLLVLAINLGPKVYAGIPGSYLQSFATMVYLLSMLIIPLMLFDLRHERKILFSAILWHALILFAYDGVFQLFGVGFDQEQHLYRPFLNFKLSVGVSAAVIVGMSVFLKQLSEGHEAVIERMNDALKEQNKQLKRQAVEIERANQDVLEANQKLSTQLEQSYNRYQSAKDSMPDVFFLLDAFWLDGVLVDFVIADLNKAAARYTKKEKNDLIGRMLRDVLPYTHTSGLFDRYRQVLLTGESMEAEHEINRPGRPPQRLYVIAVRLEEGIAVSIRDISLQKEDKKELEEALIRQKRLNEELAVREEELMVQEENLRYSFNYQQELLAQLQEKEARLSTLINNTSDAILSVDASMCLTAFNRVFSQRVFGNTNSYPLPGDPVTMYVAPAHHQANKEAIQDALNGFSHTVEYVLNEPAFGHVYAEASYAPIVEEGGINMGVTIVIRDITDRKVIENDLRQALENAKQLNERLIVREKELASSLAEQQRLTDELKASQLFLESIIENLPIGLQVFNSVGGLTQINKAQLNILGLTREQIFVGKDTAFNVLTDPFNIVFGIDKLYRSAYRGETITNREFRIDLDNDANNWPTKKNGLWVSLSAFPIFGPEQELLAVVGLCEDITERKHAEQQLVQSEARLKGLFDSTTDFIAYFDQDLKLVKWNQHYEKAIEVARGFKVEAGMSVVDISGIDNFERLWATGIRKALEGEHFEQTFTYQFPEAELWLQNSFHPVLEGEKVTGVTQFTRNVTEGRMVSLRLEESERKMKEILENTQEMMISTDTETRLIFLNASAKTTFRKLFGIEMQPGMPLYALHPSLANAWEENRTAIREGQLKDGLWKLQFDGQTLYFEFSINFVKNEATDQISGLSWIVRDVTEKVRSQNALRKVEEQISLLVNTLPMILWATDRDGLFTVSVGRGLEPLGLQPNQVVGISIFDFYAQYPEGLEALRKVFQTGQPQEGTNQVGEAVYQWKVFPVKDDTGVVVGLTGLSMDVTEQVKAQEQVNKSEYMLREAQRIANLGSYEIDFERKTTTCTDKLLEIFGLPPGFQFSWSTYSRMIHPDDRKMIGSLLKEMFAAQVSDSDKARSKMIKWAENGVDMLYRVFHHQDQRIVYLNAIGKPIIKGGRIIKIIGTTQDVTDKILAEQALKESRLNLDAFINSLSDSAWSVDLEFRLRVNNEKFRETYYKRFGRTPSESQSFFESMPDSEVLFWREKFLEAFSGKVVHFELADQTRTVSYILSPIENDGMIEGAAVLSQDISFRKEAELRLMENEQFLGAVLSNLPIGLVAYDAQGRLKRSNQAAAKWLFIPERAQPERQATSQAQSVLLSLLQKVYRHGRAILNYETELQIRPAEQGGWFSLSVFPIYTEEQVLQAVVLSLQDISDRVSNEEQIRQNTIALYESNRQMAEYKLMALRSVMNPHFIFNSLNSIQYYIASNNRQSALTYMSMFSKLIRYTLEHSMENRVMLQEEVESLQYYIALEKLRFEDRFDFQIYVDDEVESDTQIPSMLIQPYVENAIIHGLVNLDRPGMLKVAFQYDDRGYLLCTVEDNGIGRDAAMKLKEDRKTVGHKSIGMMVTQERLQVINHTNKVTVAVEDLFESGQSIGTRVKIYIAI